MDVKSLLSFIVMFLPAGSMAGQHTASLSAVSNMFESGDSLIKFQIHYIPEGRCGENVLWDISRARVSADNYNLIYRQLPADTSIMVAVEHDTAEKA